MLQKYSGLIILDVAFVDIYGRSEVFLTLVDLIRENVGLHKFTHRTEQARSFSRKRQGNKIQDTGQSES